MPHLHWIGKEKVIHHHNDVRYRPLVAKETFGDQEAAKGNMIIHGDNLEALKSLLPQYEGRVDCIYIDPPYNTGNEGWVYNDNVNHPKIKKWLGEVVGKEGEDLSRHDKWLCMMYPRLKLLHRLLSPDGVIFVSIDDEEVSNLRLVMDDVFGKGRFIGQLVWKSRQNKDNRTTTGASIDHEYILVYGEKIRGDVRDSSQFSNPDGDRRGAWTSGNMVGLADEKARPNLHYDLVDPSTGINYGKPRQGWRYDRTRMASLIEDKRILWPKEPSGRPREKVFLDKFDSLFTGFSSICGADLFTYDGTREVVSIFGERVFDFPKPSDLVKELVIQGCSTARDSIILDSFAGSGTTAHAVMKLNAEDQGNRKFILVEMEDYADPITAERVRRVIKGYGEGDKAVEGLGGGFTFYDLGAPMFDEKGNLSEPIDLPKLREYVWYVETKAPYTVQDQSEYLGCFQGIGYYLLMDDSGPIPLTYGTLGKITQKQDGYVVYGESCALSEEFLQKNHITFKKIPNQLARI